MMIGCAGVGGDNEGDDDDDNTSTSGRTALPICPVSVSGEAPGGNRWHKGG